MSDYIDVNPKTDCTSLNDESIVSFVPMQNVQEKTNVVSYDKVPYKQVKKGFTVFAKGDLIWAKITPCMQNGKSCLTDDMPTDIGFGSTEFHVVRKKNNNVYMPYIWSIFSNDNVLKAAQATFSGSAGQQRVSPSFIEHFPAVLPSFNEQVNLVSKLEEKLASKNEKIMKANRFLNNLENDISEKCNLNISNNNKLCFAIRYSKLDGVIDVKRYSSNVNKGHKLYISDVCYVIDNKVNISSYGSKTVDWIRIDDLPNQPIDIETVRTQPASEIEGSFFKVDVGDILVARLGPTILNQKIVMVRRVERETIASSEFLVLRCCNGYSAEAVMAILKTQYYKNLMYSQARGSTPSRYRLNREDMLKLPFPDIATIQEDIAASVVETLIKVKDIKQQAEKEWQEAKVHFERELLEG